MRTPYDRKIYQKRIADKALRMTPGQLVKKILSLKYGIDRCISEERLIHIAGKEESQKLLKGLKI